MTTKKVSSLKAKDGRLKAPYQLGRKNYNISAHKAILAADFRGKGGEGIEQVTNLDPDSQFRFLAFTHDFPIWWKLGVRWESTGQGQAHTYFSRGYDITVYGDEPTIGSPPITTAIFTPDDDNLEVDAYQQRQGVTLTNGVKVSGYYGAINLPAENFTLGRGSVELLAASPQIFGPMSRGINQDVVVAHTYEAIYLPEDEYTQTMRDNDNVIQLTIGGTVFTWEIVGLYDWEPITGSIVEE